MRINFVQNSQAVVDLRGSDIDEITDSQHNSLAMAYQ